MFRKILDHSESRIFKCVGGCTVVGVVGGGVPFFASPFFLVPPLFFCKTRVARILSRLMFRKIGGGWSWCRSLLPGKVYAYIDMHDHCVWEQ
jgi:hypothetical protein